MTVPVPGSEASFDPEKLAAIAMQVEVPARAYPDVRAALAAIRESFDAKQPPRILICGSLYLAGSILAENGPLPE